MMQTHNVSKRIRNHAALFIITKRALQDGIAPIWRFVILMIVVMVTIVMMVVEPHLMALKGKNFPVSFCSFLISRKGLLQTKLWSFWKILFSEYVFSQPSSSFPSWH